MSRVVMPANKFFVANKRLKIQPKIAIESEVLSPKAKEKGIKKTAALIEMNNSLFFIVRVFIRFLHFLFHYK